MKINEQNKETLRPLSRLSGIGMNALQQAVQESTTKQRGKGKEIDQQTRIAIAEAWAQGKTMRAIARTYHVSVGFVHKISKQLRQLDKNLQENNNNGE